jgi:hypothetical protein
MNDDDFSVKSAREAAQRGGLEDWVARFLASPGSDNSGLGEHLADGERWWTGPLQLPIKQLHRLAGPEGERVLCPVDEDDWGDNVDEMEDKVDDGWVPPPVIVTYRDAQLVLEDGNHRVESMRRTGAKEVWAIVNGEDPADLERFSHLQQ